jgi:hypothetical protein
MLRTILSLAFAVCLVGLATIARADDKEVTLKGDITCAKCDLKLVKDKCATVVKVKEGDKDVVYYFDEAAHKKYHSKVCTESKEGSVTGKVSEKDGKKIITVSKVDYKK